MGKNRRYHLMKSAAGNGPTGAKMGFSDDYGFVPREE